jgi:hypothetical protein
LLTVPKWRVEAVINDRAAYKLTISINGGDIVHGQPYDGKAMVLGCSEPVGIPGFVRAGWNLDQATDQVKDYFFNPIVSKDVPRLDSSDVVVATLKDTSGIVLAIVHHSFCRNALAFSAAISAVSRRGN